MSSPDSLIETALAPISRNGRALATAAPTAALVMLTDPRSPAAEAYRSLAANLQFATQATGPSPRTIGLTSAGTGEGKSTTLANLAIALAEAGRRVIVIDADLRRPGLHSLFGLEQRDGLSSVLLGEQTQLPLQDTGVAGLRLLTSGPPPANPLELLSSRRFEQVLDLAAEQADVVLVDTTPAAGLADAAVLAPRLGGMLLVVCAGRTKRDLARRAREQLERSGANLLGVVMTNVRGDEKLYSY
jgi:non-specific protein-tyrosine kinase